MNTLAKADVEAARQREIADLRQQIGKLEREGASQSAQLAQLQKDLRTAHDTLMQAQTEAAAVRGENVQLRERIRELTKAAAGAKPVRRKEAADKAVV